MRRIVLATKVILFSVHDRKTGRWRTEKFKSEKLVRSAFGSTFDQAMIHTTMGGPEPDER